MKYLTAQEVASPLFNFAQLLFGNNSAPESPKTLISSDVQQWLFERLSHSDLPLKEAIELAMPKKMALYELLTQYIMFLTINSHLKFPHDFLVGTSEISLGKSLLSYINEHRWPFPQLLGQ
ncbi:MAG: hypothetical protein ACRCRW_12580 [Aeromonadaceae bacterium]